MKSPRTRRMMLLLGLLTALASTPLRLVEAADDQARTIAELDGDPTIEPLDGGVGDEPETSIRGSGGPELMPVSTISTPLVAPVPSAGTSRSGWGPASKAERPPRQIGTLSRRLAELRRLLI